jgi:hypothetical protein
LLFIQHIDAFVLHLLLLLLLAGLS